MEGIDKEWVEVGTARFAHFNHLAPGQYTLRVQGSNGESAWKEALPLRVIIYPPWYRSDLAYLCYALFALWLIFKAYTFEIRRVQMREQLAFEHREAARIKALEQMKSNFFSNVTHEFRTPLALILEPVRQLLRNPNDPALLDKLRLVERNSYNLLGLVNQLLDLAKLEDGSMSLDMRQGNLGQTVRDVFETFLPLAQKYGVKLTLNSSDTNDFANAIFDAVKLELILNNLISNALKFTPTGGKVGIDLKKINPNGRDAVQIDVVDTGIGIPPEAAGKIFDRFYQVEGAEAREGGGTGIGLALSKELAILMGGDIVLRSEPGKGSTFTLTFPLSDAASVQQGIGPTPLQTEPEEMPAHKGEHKDIVLLIEDNADLRQFIKSSIATHWHIVEASNGEEGWQKALQLLPDIIVSDLMMPDKNGYALCEELKAHELTAHIPVILLTAKSTMDAKIKGLRHGADDYLTKPFNTTELLARMENLVETRRRLRERFEVQVNQTSGNPIQAAETLYGSQDQAFLQKLMLLIEERLPDEEVKIEDLAIMMNISRSQLHRKLIALSNQNTSDYIRNYRLARAYAMLKNGEGNVTEVSYKTGFGNEKYFSRVFKEKYGVPPSKVAH